MKTNHNTEVSDTTAHKQDFDPLTNHRTSNSSDQRERTAGTGRLTIKETGKLTERRKTQTIAPEIKMKPKKNTTVMQNHDKDKRGSRLQSCGGCRRL